MKKYLCLKGKNAMIVFKCNECGIEIPIIKKIIFGQEVEILDYGQLKCEQLTINRNYLNTNVHLCKTCVKALSARIDYELLKFKMEVLKKER